MPEDCEFASVGSGGFIFNTKNISHKKMYSTRAGQTEKSHGIFSLQTFLFLGSLTLGIKTQEL